MQFLQPKHTNTATITTIDSDDKWWEEQIGNACALPSHNISEKKIGRQRIGGYYDTTQKHTYGIEDINNFKNAIER